MSYNVIWHVLINIIVAHGIVACRVRHPWRRAAVLQGIVLVIEEDQSWIKYFLESLGWGVVRR